MSEAGPNGAFDATTCGHAPLQLRMYVGIFAAAGQPAQEGERGEITRAGGFDDKVHPNTSDLETKIR